MSWSQIAFTVALIVSIFLAFDGGSDAKDQEIRQLKQRVAVLERRTAPLTKLCGTEDFYESFFRLVQEECEKGK